MNLKCVLKQCVLIYKPNYDVLLRSKSQLKQYFQRLSDKPFLHIESYAYQPLYKAGNIFGMMARDRQIDEILEEKGA